MPRWLPSILQRIRRLAASGDVSFTLKSLRELADLELGIDAMDAVAILVALKAGDAAGRLRSDGTGEWLDVFMPRFGGEKLYVKLLVRTECIVISFHEQVDDEEDC